MTTDDLRPLSRPLKVCSSLLLGYAAIRFACVIFSAHAAAGIVGKATTGRTLSGALSAAYFLGSHPAAFLAALAVCMALFLYATARDLTFGFLYRNAGAAFLLLSAAAVIEPLARQAVEELLPYYGTIGFQ
jgi:hypothetical protein